jgi:hypothetical protein
VSLGVDLPGDEPERLIRDRRDVIGNEPQEPSVRVCYAHTNGC